MTPKQALFAKQYVIDHCGAAAAVRAGYAPRAARQTACELLARPDVRALVTEHEADAERSLGLSKERVIIELKAAITQAKERGDAAAQIAGWREIGKLCGFYAPERKHLHVAVASTHLNEELESMSDAQLQALVTEGAIAA